MSEEPTTEPETEPELGDGGKKAIAAERARADKAEKALKALQIEADNRAAAELTELERFKKENDELRATASASELAAIRSQVALEKGIPANLAIRLQGDDYDSIAADADSLASLVTSDAKPDPFPKADPSQGPKGGTGKTSNADLFAEQIADF